MIENEFIWPVRVYYEDTDAAGVVFYANYLNFMERARTEWLRKIGFEQDKLKQEKNILFAVRNVTIDYLKPAHFNELLYVKSKLINQRPASLVFNQSIYNDNDVKLCEAEIKIACVNSINMKPEPIPKTILTELDHVN
jgi:acyl-CoA thioester hydrolase